ncbi:MAG: type II toxin-antitoxin system VapC family toxin [Dongiaceae bacterium]
MIAELGSTNVHENVANWLKGVNDYDLAISVLTIREIRRGIEILRHRRPAAATALDTHAASMLVAFGGRVLPVTSAIADLWGRLLAERNKHVDDTGLAATARVHGLVVVTRNVRDFAGRGVATLDPYRRRPKIDMPAGGAAPAR